MHIVRAFICVYISCAPTYILDVLTFTHTTHIYNMYTYLHKAGPIFAHGIAISSQQNCSGFRPLSPHPCEHNEYICIYVHIEIHPHWVRNPAIFIYMYCDTYLCNYTYIYIYIYTYIHIYIYVYIFVTPHSFTTVTCRLFQSQFQRVCMIYIYIYIYMESAIQWMYVGMMHLYMCFETHVRTRMCTCIHLYMHGCM